MRRFRNIFVAAFTLFFLSGFSQTQFFNDTDIFLKKYVLGGRINYAMIQNDHAALDNLVNQVSNFPMKDEVGNTNKAFYINAYNILVIDQIIDHYPVESPENIPGFFEKTLFDVAGSSRTLNQIENEVLRPVYKDPRIHFVLVCGGLGCPPIPNFGYMPDLLDVQLENQTRKALNDSAFIQVNKEKLGLSEIFKWYNKDFLDTSTDLISYINRYREEQIPHNLEVYYYPYDWTINDFEKNESLSVIYEGGTETVSAIYAYTPSSLLKKGQVEAQLFNNLYTQTAYRDDNREKVNSNSRDTYYGGLIYALYGISKQSRINVGFDLNIKSVFLDTTKGNPLKVFRFDKTSHSRTAVTAIGPKIKFQPFRKLAHFSVQSAFWIPIAKDLESIESISDYPWMDYHMFTWWNQFFYDFSPTDKWQIFTEADLLFRFQSKNGNIPTHLDIPVSVFVSYFPVNKMSIYGMVQYSPRFQLEKTSIEMDAGQPPAVTDPFTLISDYAHSGLGIKYQLTPKFNIEISSTYFFTSKNGGAGNTYNLGFRIII